MRTKRLLFSIASVIVLWGFAGVSAVSIDTQIEDELNKKAEQEMIKQAQDLNEKITFTKVNSCESMESIMSGFLETYRKSHPKRNYNYDYDSYALDEDSISWNWDAPVGTNWAMIKSTDSMIRESSPSLSTSADIWESIWEISDYSTTNIQKVWVDEPELLKSNGNYLFYYSKADYKNKYISIIKTPTKKDLSDAEIVAKINIPDGLDNIQLFLNWDKLVILGTRYTSRSDSILWSNRTIVIIYDISDLENLSLEKLTEVYGSFEDARMINDQLYLISSISLSWYNVAWRDEPVVFEDMQPKLTDISLKKSSGSKKTYDKKVTSMPCNNIFYLLPSEDTMKQTNTYPNFTLISQISLSDLDATPKQNLVFGNVDEIHMSQTSLYLPAPIYFSNPVKCSLRWCYSSWYYRDENTLVHKFNLWKSVEYQDSTIIPGTPLNQYSMDEDDEWNFRILTTTYYDKKATHLSIIDKDIKLKWNLMNIEPGENFKSSRYIWDKLYLVTYQNIDPLFVIDIENPSKPKIIGELKIPGYSTYLHPYSDAKNGVQYLIWLGYSTTDNWYGGLKQDNTKIDLYKIDYKDHETAETKCSSLVTKNVRADLTGSCTKACTERFCYAEDYNDSDLSSAMKSLWLRSTYCPNIFCQAVADDGTYSNQKHYYRNQDNKTMTLIPNVYYVSDCSYYDKKYWWKSCNEEQRLYEDCLSKVNPENIAVSVIASYEFTGDESYTPALENPRVFVRRSNKQELVLPMVIVSILEKWTRENNWEYEYDAFLGLKGLSLKTSTALIKEVLSQNFMNDPDEVNNYRRDFEDARVGYIDDTYYFLVWWFAGFLNKDGKVATLGSL